MTTADSAADAVYLSAVYVEFIFNKILFLTNLKIYLFDVTGDYVLVGTEKPELRMYNFETKQYYVSAV